MFAHAVLLPEHKHGLCNTKYNLVANICHDGNPALGSGTYKVHVHSLGREQWYQIQDLIVDEILPQMILLSETYLQVRTNVRRERDGCRLIWNALLRFGNSKDENGDLNRRRLLNVT